MKNIRLTTVFVGVMLTMLLNSGCKQHGPANALENYKEKLTEKFNGRKYKEVLATKINGDNWLRHNGDLIGMTSTSVVVNETGDTLIVKSESDYANLVAVSVSQPFDSNNPEHAQLLEAHLEAQ